MTHADLKSVSVVVVLQAGRQGDILSTSEAQVIHFMRELMRETPELYPTKESDRADFALEVWDEVLYINTARRPRAANARLMGHKKRTEEAIRSMRRFNRRLR